MAKKEAKERQPQLSSASHLVRARTPTVVGLTEEELVAVLNREMERRRQEEEQRAVEARRIQQLDTERLRRQSLESTEPRLEVPPIVVHVSSIDTRASGLTASQKQRVVDEYYDRGVQSPQTLAITKTLGADSQGSQEVTTSVGSTPATASPGVSAQSVTVKSNVTPMLLDTPVKTSPVVFNTVQSSRIVTDTPTAVMPKPILTPDATIPVSTAASPEIQTAVAASTAPIVIVRQLKEVRPYDGSTSWKSFREHFARVAKANQWTTKEEQVQHLALALMEPPAEILRGFDDSSKRLLTTYGDDFDTGLALWTNANRPCATSKVVDNLTANHWQRSSKSCGLYTERPGRIKQKSSATLSSSDVSKRESPLLSSVNIYACTTETSTFVRPQRKLGSLQRQWAKPSPKRACGS